MSETDSHEEPDSVPKDAKLVDVSLDIGDAMA